jgi:Xaa-Pro aminopeptidase
MLLKTPASAFVERRRRLRALLARAGLSHVIVAAGLPQPRNFAHNHYPFRANSHFLYLVGQPLQGALLSIGPDHEVLFVDPPDSAAGLWTGPEPTLDELADRLELEVRATQQLELGEVTACAAPVDALTTWWLSDLLDRPLEPAYGEAQSEADALLADALIELRLRHDRAALVQLRAAAEVTCQAHLEAMSVTRLLNWEYEVCARMQAVILEQCMGLAYQPIVTVHGEVLHNERHNNPLRAGDLLLADVGAETQEGWAADVTRTWPVSGRFTPTQRDVYQVVLDTQLAAIAATAPGVSYREVHLRAQQVMAQGLSDLGILTGNVDTLVETGAVALFFPHGVGHLLGLDVHDMEDLGDRAGYAAGRSRGSNPATRYLRLDRDLEPGMLVTIEPGFYLNEELLRKARSDSGLASHVSFDTLERFADVRGVRIEDDVLVQDTGAEVLTAAAVKTIDDIQIWCQK